MTVVDELKAARALIEKPENWRKGYMKKGQTFCAVGALAGCNGGTIPEDTYIALSNAVPRENRNVYSFNDDPATTHNDVLALFDRAIALATPSVLP